VNAVNFQFRWARTDSSTFPWTWDESRIAPLHFTSLTLLGTFWDLAKEGVDNIFQISVSGKTLDWSLEQTVEETLQEMLGSFSVGEVLSLKGLAGLVGIGVEIPNILDLGIAILDLPFFSDMLQVLKDYDLSPSLSIFARFSEKYGSRHAPRLAIKVYPSRGDVRAYYRDPDVLRQVVGSMIHTLFLRFTVKHPESAIGKFLSRPNPSRLDYLWRAPPEDFKAVVVFDISSFTNNFTNSNGYLLVLIRLIEEVPECVKINTPILFQAGGRYISTRLTEVLRLYLYLNFGLSSVSDLGTYTAAGGYLGVNGNITTALFAYRVILRNYQQICQRRGVTFKPFVGGDDLLILLSGREAAVIETRRDFYNFLTKLVGAVKEERGIYLAPHETSYLGSDLLFCQSKVHVRWSMEEFGYVLESQPKLPLLSQVIEGRAGQSYENARLFLEMRSAVLDLPLPVAFQKQYLDLLQSIMCRRGCDPGKVDWVRHIKCPRSVLTYQTDAFPATIGAYEAVLGVPMITMGEFHSFRHSNKTRQQYAIKRKLVRVDSDSSGLFLALPGEEPPAKELRLVTLEDVDGVDAEQRDSLLSSLLELNQVGLAVQSELMT